MKDKSGGQIMKNFKSKIIKSKNIQLLKKQQW